MCIFCQLAPRHRSGKMYRLTNAQMANMHFIYGAADGNARRAARMYHEHYKNVSRIRMYHEHLIEISLIIDYSLHYTED